MSIPYRGLPVDAATPTATSVCDAKACRSLFATAALSLLVCGAAGTLSGLASVRLLRGDVAATSGADRRQLTPTALADDGGGGSGDLRPQVPPAAAGNISYVHLWVDEAGGTHLADCETKDLEVKKLPGGESAQYVRNLAQTVSGLNITNAIVTQQLGPNPWHHCPTTQFVVTMAGQWVVKTTDGQQRLLTPGTWLYQDDSAQHPAAEPGTRKAMHYSEAIGGPCNQMVLQWEREPVVGHVCPF